MTIPSAGECAARAARFSHLLHTPRHDLAPRLLLGALATEGAIVPCTSLPPDLSRELERLAVRPHPLACDLAGRVDLDDLGAVLGAAPVALVLLTFRRFSGSRAWIGLDHLAAVRTLCHVAGVPLVLDAEGVYENARRARQCDPYLSFHTAEDVALRTFDLADGCFSAAEGFLAVRDPDLAHRVKATLPPVPA